MVLPRANNLAEHIADKLALAIVTGQWPVGARLPSLQTLATEHATTVPTVQRALAALEARSLVSGRRGSGFTVLDPEDQAGPEVLALLILNARTCPNRATKALADLLELRRWIAAGLLRKFQRGIPAPLFARFEEAMERFRTAVETDADTRTIASLEHDLLRALVRAARQSAALAVINVLDSVMQQNADLHEVFYASPRSTLRLWEGIDTALREPERLADLARGFENLLESFDAHLV
ncbi:MAG: FadR family transcriptional regulator, partial [Candidatus Dadabacteria bacterium]